MKKHGAIWSGVLALVAVIAATGWYLHAHAIPVLQPAGEIGTKERNLIIFCAALSVTIVLPVFGLLIYFAWKYRESNTKAAYEPDQEGSWKAETLWWAFPGVLLAIISVITWRSSYALDPFKPLDSKKPTLHIQAVSMDWKWLFIYPDQHVASVNEAAIPLDTPVDFEITSDSVMTSFWVPQLGGQMYAMPGMATQLHLVAAKSGDYRGSTANISGKGFADMTFTVKAGSETDFNNWISTAKQSHVTLSAGTYAALAKPSTQAKPSYYSSIDSQLYDTTVMKYMMPMGGAE